MDEAGWLGKLWLHGNFMDHSGYLLWEAFKKLEEESQDACNTSARSSWNGHATAPVEIRSGSKVLSGHVPSPFGFMCMGELSLVGSLGCLRAVYVLTSGRAGTSSPAKIPWLHTIHGPRRQSGHEQVLSRNELQAI